MEAAGRLGGTPEKTAVYEDAIFALQTAKNAGFYTVGVWDESGAEQWEALGALADSTIRDWHAAAQKIKF